MFWFPTLVCIERLAPRRADDVEVDLWTIDYFEETLYRDVALVYDQVSGLDFLHRSSPKNFASLLSSVEMFSDILNRI